MTELDFRAIINARLVEKGLTVYWLQQQMLALYGTKHPSIYRFLKGRANANSITLGRICGILGLEVRSASRRLPRIAPSTP